MFTDDSDAHVVSELDVQSVVFDNVARVDLGFRGHRRDPEVFVPARIAATTKKWRRSNKPTYL
jgi:hypothetical protein